MRVSPFRARTDSKGARGSVLAVVLVTACLTPTDGGSRFGEAHIRPAFPDGGDPVALGIDVDSIRTVIRLADTDGEAAIDTVIPFRASGEQSWIMELRTVADEMDVMLELRSGNAAIYAGTRSMIVSEGTVGRAELELVDVVYVGATRAHRVDIDPPHVAFSTLGAARQLNATAFDMNGEVLPDRTIEWSSADAAVASVDAHGVVTSTGVGITAITAAADGISGTAQVTVDTTLARSASITAEPASLPADGTSAAQVTVVILDAEGAEVGASAGTVLLAATGPGALGGVTDHQDGTYTATFTAGTAAGTTTITGTLNGAAIADSAVIVLVPTDVSAASSTIDADSSSLIADGSSTSVVTVTVVDGNGNAVAGATIDLNEPTLGSLSGVADQGDGTYTATFTAGTIIGTVVITGTVNDAAIEDSTIIELRAAAPSTESSTIEADSTSLVADGMSTSVVTVTVVDGNGNPISGASVDLNEPTLGTLSGVTDQGDGTYTATFTAGTIIGTVVITGTVNDAAIEDSTIIELRAAAPSTESSTIEADSTSLVADGTSTSVVTVTVVDGHRNPIRGATVALNEPTLGAISDPVDQGDGSYTATFTAGTVTGTAVITGTVNGAAIADSAVIVLRAGPVDHVKTTLASDSASIAANGVSAALITVEARDSHGNLVGRSAGRVALQSTLGLLTDATDHQDGTYTARLTADTASGEVGAGMTAGVILMIGEGPDTAIVTGTLNDIAIPDSALVEFRHETGDPLTTTIDADSATLATSESWTTITVTIRDAAGNRVHASVGAVALSTSLGRLGPVTDHGDGTYTTHLKAGGTEGTAVVTGTLNGAAIADSAEVGFIR